MRPGGHGRRTRVRSSSGWRVGARLEGNVENHVGISRSVYAKDHVLQGLVQHDRRERGDDGTLACCEASEVPSLDSAPRISVRSPATSESLR